MKPDISPKPMAKSFNVPTYIIFLVVGIYFIVKKDISQAVVFWGLALIFDPFNTTIPFKKRPVYQQLWLIVHLAITLALFVLMLVEK